MKLNNGARAFSPAVRTLIATAMLALAGSAAAESNFQTGVGALTATAKLDFQVTIPKVLFLQVGAGTAYSNLATVNLIQFNVGATNVGNGTPVAATAGSGDLGNGVVTARVLANNGNVSFSSTTTGALGNGAGDTLSYSQITASTATNTTSTVLAHPTLGDGATNSITLTAVGKIVNQDAKWTYSYANTAAVPAGTYGGVNANNSRVTYTAALP